MMQPLKQSIVKTLAMFYGTRQVSTFTNINLLLFEPSLINHYLPSEMCDEITYPFQSFSGARRNHENAQWKV